NWRRPRLELRSARDYRQRLRRVNRPLPPPAETYLAPFDGFVDGQRFGRKPEGMVQGNKRAQLAFRIWAEEQIDRAVASVTCLDSRELLDFGDELRIQSKAGPAKGNQWNRCRTVGCWR